VFCVPELKRDSALIALDDFLAGSTVNDCLPVVRRRYPPVDAAMEWLDRHGDPRLTGTGACVFAAFGSQARARQVLEQAPAGLHAFVARGLNRSPLLERRPITP